MDTLTIPPLEFMRPHRIMELARDPSLVLIPISPALEWHSYHLPVGTDAIIAEEVAGRVAQNLGAAYCRVLSFGLDEIRSKAFKRSQGLDPNLQVFGMNYANLPVASEYSTPPIIRKVVTARINALRQTGFRCVALVNHHGGRGQIPLLHAIADRLSTSSFRVISLHTAAGPDFEPSEPKEHFYAGGHAGVAETMQLMAFRPDLVDTSLLPEGPLRAWEYGILHDYPMIPSNLNPRLTNRERAQEWASHVVQRLTSAVREFTNPGRVHPHLTVSQ